MKSYTAGCIRVMKGTLHTRMKLEELWDFTLYSVKTRQLASNIEIAYEKWRWYVYFSLGHWIFWSETYQIIEDVGDTRRIKQQYPKSKVSQWKIKYYYYTNNACILRREHHDLSHKVLSMVESGFIKVTEPYHQESVGQISIKCMHLKILSITFTMLLE